MAIKESSDELNPTIVSPEVVGTPARSRSFGDYLALAIGTCGVGYIPIAPGTFGSLVGLGLYLLLRGLFLSLLWPMEGRNNLNLLHLRYVLVSLEALVALLVCGVGTWAASRVEKLQGVKDPGKVVIDEVAGQYIALMAAPLVLEGWWTIIAAFLLFRFFDIVKPYPARRLESLHGGLGIMADDVVAGAYAAISVALITSIVWLS
jgi:phosphatidylglycerophosphatase A